MTVDTKERVLDVALTLFNEVGSATVSTNHIADELGISPGNLYYHYRNKAEIVRGLFDRILAAWAANYDLPAGELPSLDTIERMAAGNFEIQWQYRFFFRDLPTLLARDAVLAARYRDNRKKGHDNTLLLLNSFVASGVIEDPGAGKTEDIAQLLWLVGDFWLVFRDVGGADIGSADMQQGVRLFRHLLNPRKGHPK